MPVVGEPGQRVRGGGQRGGTAFGKGDQVFVDGEHVDDAAVVGGEGDLQAVKAAGFGQFHCTDGALRQHGQLAVECRTHGGHGIAAFGLYPA